MKQSDFFKSHGNELRFRLATGDGRRIFQTSKFRKSRTPALLSGTTLSRALSLILLEIVEQMWVNAALFVLFRTPESLHQLRISLRRLGSFCIISKMLPLPAPLLDEVLDLDLQARRLRSILASARDWEIFFQSIFPKMEKQFSKPEEQKILYLLAKSQKKKADRKARRQLDSRKFVNLFLKSESLIEKFTILGGIESIDLFRSRAVVALEKKVQENLCTGKSRKKAHRLRIALKTLRYVSEFFSGAMTKEEDAWDPKSILSILDRLGGVNDMVSIRRRFMKMRKDEKSEKRRMVIDHFINWIRRKEKRRLIAIAILFPLKS
jgi:CHAD domain-containing protein